VRDDRQLPTTKVIVACLHIRLSVLALGACGARVACGLCDDVTTHTVTQRVMGVEICGRSRAFLG
jgi:hypothetical protein